jgi:hypothetical protein
MISILMTTRPPTCGPALSTIDWPRSNPYACSGLPLALPWIGDRSAGVGGGGLFRLLP